MKVLVLGHRGMLGHMVVKYLQSQNINVVTTSKRFPNLLTLFPVLNEYLLAEDAPMQEGLYTPGNELYFSNGDEYIGAYHVHPLQGPMVGAKHQETAHDKLYYFNQLPSYANNSYDRFDTPLFPEIGEGISLAMDINGSGSFGYKRDIRDFEEMN